VPQGGLARRATLIQQVREETEGPMLVLDAGNSLMGETLAMQSEGRVLVEAMNQMGYDALAVGPLEMAKGVDVLLERAAEAEFPLLSANLVWSDTGEPVVEPYTLWERQGLRVAIIGVTYGEVLRGMERLSPGIELLDPVERVAHYVAELRPQADIVIVLSHLGIHEDKVLAEAVDGIDLIVGGLSRQLLRAPAIANGTAIIQVGYDGQWLGRLDVSGHVHALDTPRYEILSMRPDVPEDPEIVRLIEAYTERYGAED
jgi:5'-nucleotidase / UDP-sugar diphosphatase